MLRSRFCGLLLAAAIALSGVSCAQPGPQPNPTVTPSTITGTPTPGATSATPTGVAGTPSPTGTASAQAKPAAAGKMEVDALWASERPEGYIGGTSKVQIAVEKNTSQDLRVGFFEERAGGSGPMWRAAGWMAVIMSGFLLGADPTEHRYSYEIGGYVDGPSAGALMTVSTMATLLGHTVKSDATMTGTINPDGTIGPVGGIPHKIDGAAEAKKKLVLIPAGQRETRDMNKKKDVDVVAYGKSKGVEVREVADIYEAYQLLTGQALPRPGGARDGQPALPEAASDRARTKTKEWLARYAEVKEKYQALPAKSQHEFTKKLLDEATKAADKVEAYTEQGLVSAAYTKAVSASASASVAFHGARAVDGYLKGGVSSVNKQIGTLKPTMKIDAALERLGTKTPATLGDVVTLADAYGNLGLAMGLVEMGDSMLGSTAGSGRDGLIPVMLGMQMYAYADHAVTLAEDSLDMGMGFGNAPVPSQEKVQRLAELFQRAGEANLNYFDSVVLNDLAEEMGFHLDVARMFFASRDLTYVLAYSSLKATEPMKKRTRGDTASTYASLGGALNSYVLSSMLVAKYYSLDVEWNDDGEITGVENEQAMTSMLDFAEKRAKELVGLAATVGGEPVQPVLNYEQARVSREGDINDKFNALSGYWAAALQGQVIGILSDKARVLG